MGPRLISNQCSESTFVFQGRQDRVLDYFGSHWVEPGCLKGVLPRQGLGAERLLGTMLTLAVCGRPRLLWLLFVLP